MWRTTSAALLATLALAAPATAAPELVKVGDFFAPVHVASPPNDPRVFVVQQHGKVMIVGRSEPFADVSAEVNDEGSERGLLSIAFHPQFASNGLFHLSLTGAGGDLVVLEFSGASRRELVRIPHPTHANHNGGQLAFGPDGFLYMGARQAAAHRRDYRRAADLVEGPAQPVALLLRPSHRRSGHRRRGPERLRGDRRRARDEQLRVRASTTAAVPGRSSPTTVRPSCSPKTTGRGLLVRVRTGGTARSACPRGSASGSAFGRPRWPRRRATARCACGSLAPRARAPAQNDAPPFAPGVGEVAGGGQTATGRLRVRR